jgi:hypothetical protein
MRLICFLKNLMNSRILLGAFSLRQSSENMIKLEYYYQKLYVLS